MTIPTHLPEFPARAPESHKGDFGRVLLVGGSRGMSGAISLAGRAALRVGAGLVTVATFADTANIVAAFEPCYMTLPLDAVPGTPLPPDIRARLLSLRVDAIGCGPGFGRTITAAEMTQSLYGEFTGPLVVDADGLNHLAVADEPYDEHAGPRILTPHVGEFQRLTGVTVTPDNRLDTAREFAARSNVVLVLKGHETIVTDGQRHCLNPTGNPGMATGGTGDVLTGMITGLLAQGLAPFEAAAMGTYLHGLAGDLAAEQIGQVSLIARDVIDYLPTAIRHYQSATTRTTPRSP